jgi:peptidoglycan/LPS O-acetylase OafA/YrhL
VAILMVLLKHSGISMFNDSGWQGVDLFFVLSGFLITGILRRSRESTGYWRSFYVKRATRILPPLAVCLVGAALVTPAEWKVLWPYDVFFLANLGGALYPLVGGPLGVLWSLAVEEHFYLIWPFAVRGWRRSRLMQVLTMVVIAEPLLRLACTHLFARYEPIYLLTPFRLDSLALGAVLALLVEESRQREAVRRWSGRATVLFAAILAGGSMLPGFARSDNSMLYNSLGYSLVALTSAGVVGYVYLHEQSVVSRLLAWRPMVFVGRISYGLYLYHVLVVFTLHLVPQRFHLRAHAVVWSGLILGLSTLMSWLSFRYYESPILAWGHRKAKSYAAASPIHS